MSASQDTSPKIRVRREIPPGVFLVVGVFVVPGLIMLASPRGFEPGTDTFVYVAFAVVAGQTVAVLTAIGVLVAAIVRGSSVGRVAVFGIVAAGVLAVALSTVGSFAEQITGAFP
ncbi:hypothetical protein [Microbacterium sp. LWH3-1.2]|uniref:hypothetical protein n=1 Tax=Microbacterium sp. LWH3-1.2 TaxID=3135256 RepID=UPI00341E9939